jgi:hypothetical protein
MLLALLASFAALLPQEIVEAHPDGSPKFRCEARAGEDGAPVRHGKATSWHPNGKVESEGRFEDGLASGKWEFRFESGRRKALGSYSRGLRAGTWKFFRDGGGIELEGKYVEGVRDGEWKRFDAKQQVIEVVEYRREQVVDEARGWTWQGESVNGHRNGTWLCTRADGSVAFVGDYVDTVPHGPWAHFFADGSFDGGWLSATFERGARVAPLTELPDSIVSSLPEPSRAEARARRADPKRLPPIAVDDETRLALEAALAGDAQARAKLLDSPVPTMSAAVARLAGLDLASERGARLAERIHLDVLAPVLHARIEWPASHGDRTQALLRWHSLSELLRGETIAWRLSPEMRWFEVDPDPSAFLRPEMPGELGWLLEPLPPAPEPEPGTIGIGGGPSPRYAGRFGGRKNLKARGGSGTEQPLVTALEELASSQRDDGSWSSAGGSPDPFALAVTAEAVLAFAGDGSATARTRPRSAGRGSGSPRGRIRRAAASERTSRRTCTSTRSRRRRCTSSRTSPA